MEIIDAQIHLWGTGLPTVPAHRQVTAFTPEEAIVLMDEADVFGPHRMFWARTSRKCPAPGANA